MVQSFILLNTLSNSSYLFFQQIDVNKYNNFLVLGYIAMWAAVMIYLVILANRQKNARDDLNLMAELLQEEPEEIDEEKAVN